MEESPPVLGSQSEIQKTPTMSLPARLLNVFAAPGEVFEEVKAAPRSAANWLVPVLLTFVVGAISSFVLFSQPAILQQIHEEQAKAFDQMVKDGKMSQADADRAMAMVEKYTGPGMLMIFGVLGSAVVVLVRLFWWALVLWLLGRWFLKTRFGYMKTVEIVGLGLMISVLGAIITLLLGVGLGRMYVTAGPGLLIGAFDVKNKMHLLLGTANVFNFWLVGVMSVGLARLAGTPVARAAVPVFVYWFAFMLLLILIGLGQFAL